MTANNNSPSAVKIKLSSLNPLTFECSECGQQFDADEPKTLEFLTAEITRHNRDRHDRTPKNPNFPSRYGA